MEYALPDFCAAGVTWADDGGGGVVNGGGGDGGGGGEEENGGAFFSAATLMRCCSGVVAAVLIVIPCCPSLLVFFLRVLGITGGKDYSVGDVLSYRVDNWLSTSQTSKPVTLALITVWQGLADIARHIIGS
jgi:hypothetical protein